MARLRPRLLACVAAVGVAAAVGVVTRDDAYPEEWDTRVVELVAFVEDERGHPFEHPVPVDFLDEEAYAELTRTDAAGLTDEERDEIEHAEGLLRAVGLVEGDVDLFESSNDLSDTGTLAYYDIVEERIVVRGTEVTPDLAVTLVHELTHVLQDQVFGLDLLGGGDGGDGDAGGPTSGELFAFRALAEGDAERIERRYLDSLDAGERAEVEQGEAAGLEDLEAEGIPIALEALFAAPYALGGTFVDLLDVEGDLDDAFDNPPSTEEQLLDPFRFLDGDEAHEVEAPSIGGVEVVDEGDLGAVSLLLVLAERIDLAQALDAAVGWGGDAYVSFERDGRSCISYAVEGDSPSDFEELSAAVEAWVDAAPSGSASFGRAGDLATFESCDPGAEAAGGAGAGIDVLSFAATRTQIAAGALADGAERDQAVCFADAVVDAFTPAELVGEELPTDFQSRVDTAAASCR